MPVPKRKSSKSRKNIDKHARYSRKIKLVVKTKDKRGVKRPHVDEYIEI